MALDFPASPTIGQVYTSGAASWRWDGAKWVGVSGARYVVGCFAPGVPAANQVLLQHTYASAASLNSGQARGAVAATASTAVRVQKALAASPTSFSDVATITWSAGGIVGAVTGLPASFAAGDTIQLVAAATPDASLAGISATLVGAG